MLIIVILNYLSIPTWMSDPILVFYVTLFCHYVVLFLISCVSYNFFLKFRYLCRTVETKKWVHLFFSKFYRVSECGVKLVSI